MLIAEHLRAEVGSFYIHGYRESTLIGCDSYSDKNGTGGKCKRWFLVQCVNRLILLASSSCLILSTIPPDVVSSFAKHELLFTALIPASVSVLLEMGWKVDFPRRLEQSVNRALTAIFILIYSSFCFYML